MTSSESSRESSELVESSRVESSQSSSSRSVESSESSESSSEWPIGWLATTCRARVRAAAAARDTVGSLPPASPPALLPSISLLKKAWRSRPAVVVPEEVTVSRTAPPLLLLRLEEEDTNSNN